MGEHGTWFDYLNRFDWYQDFMHSAEGALGRDWTFLMFGPTHFTLIHVFMALLVVGFGCYAAFNFHRSVKKGGEAAIVPPSKFNLRHFFEVFCDSVYGLVVESLGEKNGRKFFPFIGALAMFIFFGNLIGMIPGFASPNDTLKTNVALALLVFCMTHYYGVKEHGLFGYLKHFMGPVPALSWLILPIELISHLARPVSLSLRLMGNMLADHKVIFAFFTLVPILLPLPFYLLGLLVCFVQTLVFCLLTLVYLGGALEHEH
jgi:F-type H+-transporting ATPase subunit a